MLIEEHANYTLIVGDAADRAKFAATIALAKAMPVYTGGAGPSVVQMREGALRLADSPLARQASTQVEISPVTVRGIPAAWFRARELRREAPLLYFHGGGFVCGSVEGSRGIVAALALVFAAPILAVGYAQSPERPFPAAVEDARASYEWLTLHSPHAITLVGESAGGALALSTALHAARHGRRPPRAVIACSPWFDLTMSGASWTTNAGQDLVTREMGDFFRDSYLAGADPRSPDISPLNQDLSDAPPLLIQVGSRELGLDDSRALIAKAQGAGRRPRFEIYQDLPHGFLKFLSPIGDIAIQRMADWEKTLGVL